MHIKSIFFLLIVSALGLQNTIAQENRKKIEIKYAPYMSFEESKPEATILTRNNNKQVHIAHEGLEMWCDEAIYYSKKDFIEAYGNVKINQGDTLLLNSSYVEYDGATKHAVSSGNVVLKEPSSTLNTDRLLFDRTLQQAHYNTGGKVVKDTSGVITSTVGRYFIKTKKYQFLDKVKLVNPEYIINSDQLDFYTESGYAYFYGPTTILSSTSTIYCERGFYNTSANNGHFIKNAQIFYEDRLFEGDSIYFDRTKGFASATNNIKLTDTINSSVVKGHYAELFRFKDSVFITNRALAITVRDRDSIYIHGDTLMVTGKAENRITRAFYNAKLYKSNLSGKADSIHVDHQKGLTQLINISNVEYNSAFQKKRHPILWNLKNQITGDSIHLISDTKTEKLDSLKVFFNAFVISKDTIGDGYNQISGKTLYGIFENNQLNTIDVLKNAETIYYLRNGENELVGIDKSKSGKIKIWLSDNTIEEIRKINQVEGNTIPEEDFLEKDKLLIGFEWRETERPKSVQDLFIDDPPLNLKKIKGLNSPVPKQLNNDMLINTLEKGEIPITNKIPAEKKN